MTIRNFFRYRVWPWSVINELRGGLERSKERVDALEKAIKEWHKTKDETELNAIAGGVWSESFYRILKVCSEPNEFLVRLINIAKASDE